MRCKICHLVFKYPSDKTKETLTCKSCRKQIEIVQVLSKHIS